MENKINIAELLKDCPRGMELYSTIYGTVYFEGVRDTGNAVLIDAKTCCNTEVQFYPDGKFNTYYSDSEMTLFPSKDVRTWEGFLRPFEDGDIVATTEGFWIGITTGGTSGRFIPTYCVIKSDDEFEVYLGEKEKWQFNRLATEEEKERLFRTIKENGYRWNAKTKTLEKLVKPKFKVGDKIKNKNSGICDKVIKILEDCYLVGSCLDELSAIGFDIQDNWELATPVELEPKFKVGDTIKNKETEKRRTITKIHKDCYECDDRYVLTFENQDDWELVELKFNVGDRIKKNKDYISGIITNIYDDGSYKVEYQGGGVSYLHPAYQDEWELVPDKFDISTLIPFESRVLVRGADGDLWKPAIYGFLHPKGCYVVGGVYWIQCIPYEQNKHLLGTTDVCDDYFITW